MPKLLLEYKTTAPKKLPQKPQQMVSEVRDQFVRLTPFLLEREKRSGAFKNYWPFLAPDGALMECETQ
ncbi:hypothetical protein [Paraburkholderia sediminicola]|uniref:hypothetical protein n=1 Tax=Paraburkholderia sediminicola TaxID=458836 RepID=UPI0038BC5947